MASCPQCKAQIREIQVQSVMGRETGQGKRFALLYCCPMCDVVLGAGPDAWAEQSSGTRSNDGTSRQPNDGT